MNLDRYRAFDKLLHITVSTLICVVLGVFMIERMGPWGAATTTFPFIVPALLTLIIGVGKETYDHYHTGLFDEYDLVADGIGTGLGLLILLAIFL